MNNFIKRIHSTFFLTNIEKKIYKYFKKDFTTSSSSNIILLQCVEDLYYFGLFGKIVKSLKEKDDIQAKQFVIRNLTVGASKSFSGLLKGFLFNNKVRDNKWIKLYSSYCNGVAYRHENSTNVFFDIKAFFQAYKIVQNIKTKQDLLNLTINDIKVGDLIYDSYLRYKPAPSVDIDDFYLCIVIWQCIRNIEMTQNYFNEYNPQILLTSYSTYIQHGITVRVAIKFDTKVYSFGNNQNITKLLTKDDFYHTAKFSTYNSDFNNFSEEEKTKYYQESKIALDNRLNGNQDIATSYMKESAYKINNDIEIPNIKDHVIIFLHDFFDSPHVYGDMVFTDFLEWVEYTINILEKENIPYSLKPHPNEISDSAKVTKELKIKYPKANFISTKITNKQLVDARISIGISVYGTVAHELVYMGVPVILCASNPHSSYDFCYEARTKDEYKSYIKNHKNLNVLNKEKEVLSFYYMHNNKSKRMYNIMKNIIKLRKHNYSLSSKFNYDEYIHLLEKIEKEISSNLTFKNLAKGLEI